MKLYRFSDCEEDFLSRYEAMKSDWDPKFTQYVDIYLKSDFQNHICKYVVEGRNMEILTVVLLCVCGYIIVCQHLALDHIRFVGQVRWL